MANTPKINWATSRPYPILVQLIVAGGFGLMLAAATLLMPDGGGGLIIVLGAIGLFVILKRPELGILAIILMTSTIFDPGTLPGFIRQSFKIVDYFFAFLVVLCVLRLLAEPNNFYFVHSPIDGPLLVFLGVAVLATTRAIVLGELELWAAYESLRVLTYYLVFFLVTNFVRDQKQLRFLLYGLFVLSSIVAIVMIIQFAVGNTVTILPGRVEGYSGTSGDSITRILPPGQSTIYLALITLSTILVLTPFTRQKIWLMGHWGLSIIAVLFTFNRSFWASGVFVLLILGGMLRNWQDRRRYMIGMIFAIVTLIAIIGLSAIFPRSLLAQLSSTSITRFSTMSDFSEDDSFQYRYPEYSYAWIKIQEKPLLGIGLGANYRPRDSRLDAHDASEGMTAYMHNGHLWIVTKTGIIGYSCMMYLAIRVILRGLREWRFVSDPFFRSVAMGFTLTLMATISAAVVNPIQMEWYWTPLLGLMLGVNEVIFRLYPRTSQQKSTL